MQKENWRINKVADWRSKDELHGKNSQNKHFKPRSKRDHISQTSFTSIVNQNLIHLDESENLNNSKWNSTRRSKKSSLQSLHYMENLLKKSDEDFILILNSDLKSLLELTQSDLSKTFIVLLMRILHKISHSPFRVPKISLLQIILNDAFVRKIKEFIAYLPIENKMERQLNNTFWTDPNEFWNNLFEICECVNNILPTFACDTFSSILSTMIVIFPSLEQQNPIYVSNSIKQKITNLQEILSKQHEQHNVVTVVNEVEPLDDFREIDIYPNDSELMGQTSFLRPNKIIGPYENIQHYLDVQFRLLREDFIAPLRSGIKHYVTGDSKTQRNDQIRIHKKIRFICAEQVNECHCFKIRFNFEKRIKKFNFEQSKRFMFGGLLCFTRNSFKQILFGRVAKRDIEDLENGTLIVSFDKCPPILLNVDYLMVECNIFFEPYYHVLCVLKNIYFDEFPMEKYIVQVNSEIQLPKYLRNEHGFRRFIPVRRDLNESQKIAYEAALSQEFVLIQGPPGTGKTYLGLEIVKTLISWKGTELRRNLAMFSYKLIQRPILIVCFTNHALDQFLEGLLDTLDVDDDIDHDTDYLYDEDFSRIHYKRNIIRVGGQSKNEKLDEFNLRYRVQYRNKKNKHRPTFLYVRDELGEMHREIWNFSAHLDDLNQYNGVIDFKYLELFDKANVLSELVKATSVDQLAWLCGPKQDHEKEVENKQVDCYIEIEIDSDEFKNEQSEIDLLAEDDWLDPSIFCQTTSYAQRLTKLHSLKTEIWKVKRRLAETTDELERCNLEDNLKAQLDYLENLELRLNKEKMGTKKTRMFKNKNPHNMTSDERWQLYFCLLEQYKFSLAKKSII